MIWVRIRRYDVIAGTLAWCVAVGCSYTQDRENGIFLHKIPFTDDRRPVVKKRRKNWVDFGQRKAHKPTSEPEATGSSRVCLVHFKAEQFQPRQKIAKRS